MKASTISSFVTPLFSAMRSWPRRDSSTPRTAAMVTETSRAGTLSASQVSRTCVGRRRRSAHRLTASSSPRQNRGRGGPGGAVQLGEANFRLAGYLAFVRLAAELPDDLVDLPQS